MYGSLLDDFLAAVDRLDAQAAGAFFADDATLLTVDQRQAKGRQDVIRLLSEFLAALRHSRHTVTARWHDGDTWIAELDASYELRDWMRVELPRIVVLRADADKIAALRFHGTTNQRLEDHDPDHGAFRVGARLIPPL